jgi:DNA segregation ATPase FtsK/SpoIIIE-like protein
MSLPGRDEIYAGADLTEAEIAAATAFVKEKPSTSYLQRKMQIPYSHAMRIMGYLEAAHIVSPPNAANVRTYIGW